ncbi:MAG: hypothetical protein NTY19_49035 [Planctomycetota bacterium]|nr:hypothetical protein [Planctomycetota bacterium]
MTNQWLGRGTGFTVRSRAFSAEEVNISARKYDASRSKCLALGAVVEIAACRGRLYQEMYLQLEEVEKVAVQLIGECSNRVRAELAVQVLKGMTDTELIEVLAAAIKGRGAKAASAK